MNYLSISYLNTLKFKSMKDNGYPAVDFDLRLSIEDSIELLNSIRNQLRNCGRSYTSDTYKFGCYEFSVTVEMNEMKISIMEYSGEKSRPIGVGLYHRCTGGRSLLEGFTHYLRILQEYV